MNWWVLNMGWWNLVESSNVLVETCGASKWVGGTLWNLHMDRWNLQMGWWNLDNCQMGWWNLVEPSDGLADPGGTPNGWCNLVGPRHGLVEPGGTPK